MRNLSASVLAALLLGGCKRGGEVDSAGFPFTDIVLLDDYQPVYADGAVYPRSRIDRPRDFFGLVDHGPDRPPIFNTQGETSGVRYQVGRAEVGMRVNQTLGTVLKYDYQPVVAGVRMQMVNGRGDLTVRFLDPAGKEFWSRTERFTQSGRTAKSVFFQYTGEEDEVIGSMEWELRNGYGQPLRAELLMAQTTPLERTVEKAFLYTFGQLTECYDEAVGLLVENCRDETGLRYTPDTSGLYALAVAIAEDLGYVEREVAVETVTKIRDAILALPTDPETKLLPSATDGKALAADGHWSSLGTVIAFESLILASEALGQSSTNLQLAIDDIDWDILTTNGGVAISAGYDSRGDHVGWRHGVFGGKAVLLQIAHAAATGDVPPMDFDGYIPTWDGSGYDNELGALLFPLDEDDYVPNDWVEWRDGQFWIQRDWTAKTPAGDRGLFGLSASEVPEPWAAEKGEPTFGNWGIGGHNKSGNDGFDLLGYTVTTPHYPAMVMAEYAEHIPTFDSLIDSGHLSVMNAVESIAVGDKNQIHWNHHKRSWTLSLQALGLLRALSGDRYLPYQELRGNSFLRRGYEEIFPRREL